MFPPPHDLPMLCAPFVFRAPMPLGCTLTPVLSMPRGRRSPPSRCSLAASEARRIAGRAQGDIRDPHVPALNRQISLDDDVLFCRDLFHDWAPLDCYLTIDRHLSKEQSKILVLTGPSLIVLSSFCPFATG